LSLLPLLILSVTPGFAYLAYFVLKDRYDTEPLPMVGKVFLWGVLLVFPTMVVQRGMVLAAGDHPLLFSFVISALVEETLKWFLLYQLIYKQPVFDEPYDGIVYAVSLSLGFATLENVIYALYLSFSWEALLMRAFLPVAGHALFGVTMGYYLGKAKFASANRRRLKLVSVLLPVFWHGLYDYIMLTAESSALLYIIPLMAVLWLLGLGKVRRANEKSPFRPMGGKENMRL
jgi:RsiW-degrading membrane proteinase PrsW (M82 family)